MRQRAGVGRASWPALAAVCVLPVLGGAAVQHARAVSSRNVAVARTLLAPRKGRPEFRLGSAARPFSWSTAVGDLNADGRPDFAAADRLGRRAAGFAYSMEFSIAGGPSQSVTFVSPHDAVSVSLCDVDHDRDLDVVVTATVSRAVVAVWLNDGAGRFHRATSATNPAGLQARDDAIDAFGADRAVALASPPRRNGDAAWRACAAAHAVLTASTVTDRTGPARPRRRPTAIRPRAPPARILA